ncbi:MAG: hypothetical protein ACLPXB_13460 [Thiobacillaceae bacterium]
MARLRLGLVGWDKIRSAALIRGEACLSLLFGPAGTTAGYSGLPINGATAGI